MVAHHVLFVDASVDLLFTHYAQCFPESSVPAFQWVSRLHRQWFRRGPSTANPPQRVEQAVEGEGASRICVCDVLVLEEPRQGNAAEAHKGSRRQRSAPRPCASRVRRSRRALALFADATPEKAALHADQMKTKRSAMAAKESKRRAGAGRKLLAMSCVNESLARMFCHARAQTWMNLQGSFYQTHGRRPQCLEQRRSTLTRSANAEALANFCTGSSF